MSTDKNTGSGRKVRGRLARVLGVVLAATMGTGIGAAVTHQVTKETEVYAAPNDVGSAKQRCDDARLGKLKYRAYKSGSTGETEPTGATFSNTPGYSGNELEYVDILNDGSAYRGGNEKSWANKNDAALDDDPRDFAAVLPYGTVYIDVSKLKFDNTNATIDIKDTANFKYNVSADITNYANYLKDGSQDTNNAYYAPDSTYYGANAFDLTVRESKNQIYYAGGIGAYTGDKSTTKVVEGQNGAPLIVITYKDAAVLNDGTRGDLVISYTKVVLESKNDFPTGEPFGIIEANWLLADLTYNNSPDDSVENSERIVTNIQNGQQESIGVQISFDISVIANGQAYDGLIFWESEDLDVRGQTIGGKESSDVFAESMTILDGAKSYAVTPYYDHEDQIDQTTSQAVPPLAAARASYVEDAAGTPIVSTSDKTANGVRFYSKNRADNATFDTGFAALVSSAKTSLLWTGSQNSGSMGTKLFDNTFSYEIEQSVSTDGALGSTTGGNLYVKTYNPYETTPCNTMTPNSGITVAGASGTVTHTVKANDGFKLDQLIIDSRGVDPAVLDTAMTSGTATWTSPDGTEYTFVYDSATGELEFSFENIGKNHKVYANFVPKPSSKPQPTKRYLTKTWNGGSVEDRTDLTLVATAYRLTPVDEISAKMIVNNSESGSGYRATAGANTQSISNPKKAGDSNGFTSTHGNGLQATDPNGDGVINALRGEYYPDGMGSTAVRMVYDELLNTGLDKNEALKWTWDGRHIAWVTTTAPHVWGTLPTEAYNVEYTLGTGTDYQEQAKNKTLTANKASLSVSGVQPGNDDKEAGIAVFPAWSGAELDKDSAVKTVIDEFKASKNRSAGANVWIYRIATGQTDTFNSWNTGENINHYAPTVQAAALLPVDGYNYDIGANGPTDFTKTVTITTTNGAPDTSGVTVNGDTWTIEWPVAGDSSTYPSLPEYDNKGNRLYWFVTEKVPDGWENVRYANGGDMPVENYGKNTPNVGTAGSSERIAAIASIAAGQQSAVTANPYILGGVPYYDGQNMLNLSPGYTSRAYLGGDLDQSKNPIQNGGNIVNQKLTEATFTKKWTDNSSSHTKDSLPGELFDKFSLMAEIDGLGDVDVTEFYINTKNKKSRKHTKEDGSEADYVTVTAGTGTNTFDIKFEYLPTYFYGDVRPDQDNTNVLNVYGNRVTVPKVTADNYDKEVAGIGTTNNPKWTIYGYNTDWQRTANPTPDTANAHQVKRYYLVEKSPDGYFSTYENVDDTNTTTEDESKVKNKAYDKGTIDNIQSTIIKAEKVWKDYDNALVTRDDVYFHIDRVIDSSSGNTINSTVDEDYLPPQKLAKDADSFIKTWGDNTTYTAADGTTNVYSVAEAITELEKDTDANGVLPYWAEQTTEGIVYKNSINTYKVNLLPEGDSDGNIYKYIIRETDKDGNDLTRTGADTGLKGYVSMITGWDDYEVTGPDANGVTTRTCTATNIIDPVGTVSVKADKALDGRTFKSGDEFTFVLAGEDGAPMPVTTAVQLPSQGEDTPDRVVKTITPTGGVRAEVDFGVISYRKSDLDAVKVTYGTPASGHTGYTAATEEQKNSIRFWTVKTTTDETTYDMLDTVDAAAFGSLDDSIKNTATAKAYEKVFSYVVTENPTHPDYVENDTAVRNMKVRVFYNEKENKLYIDDEDGAYDGSDPTNYGVRDITAETTGQLTTPDVTLKKVYFTNEYDNTVTWTPQVTKTLNGRPIKADQFKDYFTIKAADTDENVTGQVRDRVLASETPMPGAATSGAYPHGGEATSNSQVIKSATAAPKGTNDVKGIVGFDTITYTNEDLKKEIYYNTASATDKAKVIEWTKGSIVYGPIPADATAEVTLANGSTGSVAYDAATEAQREEVTRKATAGEGWTSGGKTYIDDSQMSAAARATALAGSQGYYYMDSRVFTYNVWESGTAAAGYTVDTNHNSEANGYVVKVTVTRNNNDGTITATADMDQLAFENKYDAEGTVNLKANKALTGRDFASGDSFTFTVDRVSGDTSTPLPANTTVTITPTSGTTADIDFGNITFTEEDLKAVKTASPGAYDARRTADGYYEKSFTYVIKETAGSSGGVTYDGSTITCVVTVREDDQGNIKVVSVNGNTAGDTRLGTSFTDTSVRAGTFTNEYVSSGTATVRAMKTLKGGKLSDDQFWFQLYDSENKVVSTAANKADGSITFDTIAYNLEQVKADEAAGKGTKTTNKNEWTYTYTIKELQTDGRGTDDITYDTDTETVTVVVSDEDSDGVLDTTVKYGTAELTDSNRPEFENTVNTRNLTLTKVWIDNDADGISVVTRPDSVTLTVTANIADTTILSGDAGTEVTKGWTVDTANGKSTRTFTLTAADDAVATNAALWKKTISGLPKYDSAGIAISYTVDEADADVPASYTKTVIPLLNTVVNTYQTTAITGTKVWVDGNKTHDNTTELNGNLKVQRSTDGTTWSDVTLADEGAHIDWAAAAPTNPHTQTFTITGLPEKNGSGKYIYRVFETAVGGDYVTTYSNTDDSATAFNENSDVSAVYNNGTITNKLEAKIRLSGTKTWVEGQDSEHVNKGLGLTLHRESTTNGGNMDEDVTGAVITGSWNVDSGDATYKFGTYDTATTTFTEGEYDKYDANGYEYIYTVTGETGTPDNYTPSYNGMNTTNTFKKVNAKITPEFIKKTADMPADVASKTFTFLLAPETNTAAIGTDNKDTEKTVTVTGNSEEGFDFGEMTFTEAGTYAYKLVEKAEDGWICSSPVTEFKINVTDNKGTLEAAIEWPTGADVDNKKLRITNTYDPKAVASSPAVEKKLTGRNLKGEEFTFTMTGMSAADANAAMVAADYKDASGKATAGTHAKSDDGTAVAVDLNNVTFTEAGKYLFELSEDIPLAKTPGITYDETKYRAQATVAGADDGKLSVTWKIVQKSVDGGASWSDINESKAAFANTYGGSVESLISVKKTLVGRKLNADEFEFVLAGDTTTDAADGTIQTKKNGIGTDPDNENKSYDTVTFDKKIKFTVDDLCDHNGNYVTSREFTYKVFEKAGSTKGVTYDSNVHELKATLTWNTVSNKLEVNWALDGTAIDLSAKAVEFTNSYNPDAVSSAFIGVKKYLSVPDGQTRDMLNDEFLFEILDSAGKRVALGTNGDQASVATDPNDKTADVTFAPITFTKDMVSSWSTDDANGTATGEAGAKYGDLTYTIKEIKGNNADDLEYTDKAAAVTARLVDKGDGQLTVTWIQASGEDYIYTNTVPEEKTSMPVRVSWISDTDSLDKTTGSTDGVTPERPEQVTVTLQQKVNGEWKDVVDGSGNPRTITLTKSEDPDKDPNNWEDTTTFTNLPKYNAAGEIEYRVVQTGYKLAGNDVSGAVNNGLTEEVIPAGYTGSRESLNVPGKLTTLTNAYDTTTFTGHKKWEDGDQTHINSVELTDKLTVERSANGNDWTQVPKSEYHIDWSGDDEGTFTISGLTKYYDAAADPKVEYQYRVKETAPVHYNIEYWDRTNHIVLGTDYIENGGYFVNNAETRDISVTKVWQGDDDHKGDRKDIQVKLYRTIKGQKSEALINGGSTAGVRTLATGTDHEESMTWTWRGLPKYEGSTNVEISYTVEEVNVPDNYVATVTGDMANGFTITNTHATSYYDFKVLKKWEDDNNAFDTRPDSVTAKLYRKLKTEGEDKWTEYKVNDQPVQVTLTADKNWTDTIKDLPAFDTNGDDYVYRARELDAKGQSVDQGAGYNDNYTAAYDTVDTDSVTTITNSLIYDSIKVTKSWNSSDNNNSDGLRTDVKVHLYMRVNGVDVQVGGVEPLTLATGSNHDENMSGTWDNLPVYDKNRDKIIYVVKEEAVPGYVPTYTPELSAGLKLDGNAATEDEYKIENKYTPTPDSLKVTKVWDDDNNRDGKRGYVTVTLYKKVWNGTAYGDETKVKDITLGTANGENDTFRDLPTHENGKPVIYSVDETDKPDDYTKVITADVSEGKITGYTVTNIHTPETTTATITKSWSDSDNAYVTRPDSVTMHLYKKVGDADPVDTGKKITLASADNWTYTMEGLPTHELVSGESKEVSYYWKEDVPAGYTASSTDPVAVDATTKAATITNTVVVDNLKVSKEWDDADDAAGLRPDKVIFHLYKADGTSAGVTSKEVTGSGSATWENLPVYDASGAKISYKVVEESVAGYTTTYTPAQTIELDGDKNADVQEIKATNSLASETTEVKVTKIWDDDNDRDGKRVPATVTLYEMVYNETSGEYDQPVSTGKKETLEVADKSAATFSDLPATKNGKTVIYTVVEDKVDGYLTPVVSGSQVEGFTVTNTRTDFIPVSVEVTKIWEDEDNKDELRPNSVSVVLYADGQPVKHEPVVSPQEGNKSQIKFNNLPKYRTGPTTGEIDYTVKEETVPDGYTSKVEGNQHKGYTITNTHVTETASLKITKIWDDNDDQDGLRPEELKVKVTGDDTKDPYENTVTLKSSGDWTTTLEGLRLYKVGTTDERVTYTVSDETVEVTDDYKVTFDTDETKNPDYIIVYGDPTTLESDRVEELTVTNKHTPETTQIEAEKIWDDNNDQDGQRPGEVRFTLVGTIADKIVSEISKTLSNASKQGDNTWTVAFEGVDKKKDGKVITYKVVEQMQDALNKLGYTVSGDGTEGNEFKITNTRVADTVDVTVTKKWDDGDDVDDLRPSAEDFAANLKLYADTEELPDAPSTKNDNGDGTYTYTWTGLQKNRTKTSAEAATEAIEYSIAETTEPDGYDVVGESEVAAGGIITNKHTPDPGTTSVTITKVWDDDSNRDGIRPETTDYDDMVTLNENGVPVNAKPEVTDNGDNTFTLVWNNLPASKDGSAIEYTVTEGDIDGYTAEPETVAAGETITNKHDIATRKITVKKDWDDAEFYDQANYNRPKDISAALYDISGDPAVQVGDTVGLSDANEWSYTWTVPVNSAGEAIEYEVREVNVPVGFEYSGHVKATGTDDFIATITNTPKTEEKVNSLDLVVTKTNNKDKVLAGAKFLVTAPDKSAKEYVTNDRGELSITFEKEGTYTVKEIEAPDGYTIGDAKEYTVEVGKDFVKVHLDKEKSVWTKLYDLVFGETAAFADRYTAGKTLVIGNPPAEYNVTIVKTFTGIDALPDTFKVNVAYTDVEGEPQTAVLELADAVKKEAGKVTWVFDKATYLSSVTVSEADYAAAGYTTEVVKGVDTLFIEGDATASLENKYESPEEITVKYVDPENEDANKRTVLERTIDRGEDEPAQPGDPARDGYKFVGWERTIDPDTGDVTYTAQWEKIPEPDKITVTYKDGDKTIVSEVINKGDDEPGQPEAPEKEGYTFGGWLREVDKDGNVTYKANRIKDPAEPSVPEPGKVKVVYEFGNGTQDRETEITRGDSEPAQPEDPAKDGYTFGGWMRSEKDGVVTYTANWIRNPETPEPPAPETLKVTYMDEATGTVYSEQTFKRGQDEPAYTKYPEKDGYIFGGWIRSTDADGNVTYKARWIEDVPAPVEKPNTVTYIDPLAEEAVLKSLDETDPNANVDPADAPSHDGLQFMGWKEAFDKNGNRIMTAMYSSDCANPQNERSVTYRDLDNGKETIYQRSYITDDEDIPTPPADPSKEGYTFKEWDKEEDEKGNIIYTAVWEKIPEPEETHTVKYVDPEGSYYEEFRDMKEGEADPKASREPARDGYLFGGWDRAVDKDGNVTYTAKWIEVKHTVTFVDGRTGKATPFVNVPHHGSVDVPAAEEHEGYEFAGWRTPDGKIVKDLKVEDVTGDEVYVAVYEPKVQPKPDLHTVTFVDARTGEMIIPPATVEDGGSTEVAPIPDHGDEGYVFKYWRRDTDGKTFTAEELRKIENVTEDMVFTAVYDRSSDETVVVQRTILYRYITRDGNVAAESVKQTITFTRKVVTDSVTGEKTYGEWVITPDRFPAAESPVIADYTVDRAVVDELVLTDPYAEYEKEEWVIYTPVPKTFTVTFVDGQGNVLKVQEGIPEHGSAQAPEEPKREGYAFVGWDDKFDDVTGDLTVTALWVKEYTVTYKEAGPDGKIYTREVVVRGDEEPPGPDWKEMVKAGFIFDGWDEEIDEHGNKIYTARWIPEEKPVPDTYWITYVDEDGTVYMEKTTVKRGDKEPEAPAVKKDGYEFAGWNKTTDEDGNVTYTAVWKKTEEAEKPTEPVTPDQPTEPVTPDQPAQPATPGTVPSTSGTSSTQGTEPVVVPRTTPASGQVTPAETPDRTSGVDTGDSNYTVLWIVMAAAAAGVAVAAAVAMRRRKGEEE